MTDCIFCKIARGEIPCARLYEDEHVLSFLDINPINPGHALVITKKHYPTIFEVPVEELKVCIETSQRVARAIHGAIGASGLNLLQNNFRSAGQLIEHVHFHLIPRHTNDGFLTSWPGKPYPSDVLDQTLQKIKALL
jgi:histidine triad (HIT) family protein